MVAFDQSRCHRHRFPDIGEPLAADAVGGKLANAGWSHFHSGKIANHIVVFGIIEPAQRHRSGVADSGGRLRVEGRPEPGHQLFALGLAWLRRVLGWHVAGIEAFRDIGKNLGLGEQFPGLGEPREVEIVVLGRVAVALSAGFGQQRMDFLLESQIQTRGRTGPRR